jgi:hypothetical protein
MEGWLIFCMVMALWIIVHHIVRMHRTTQREKTRREIAAYIAEGTMTPESGERLMAAGERPEKR